MVFYQKITCLQCTFCFVTKSVFLQFTSFCVEKSWSKKMCPWRKNDKYEVCDGIFARGMEVVPQMFRLSCRAATIGIARSANIWQSVLTLDGEKRRMLSLLNVGNLLIANVATSLLWEEATTTQPIGEMFCQKSTDGLHTNSTGKVVLNVNLFSGHWALKSKILILQNIKSPKY